VGHKHSMKSNDYFSLDRSEMLRFIPKNINSVLEVGCSSGEFGKLIKCDSPAVTVWGIEQEVAVAALATDKLDKVICGTFEAEMPDLIGKQFDCIVFNDVLEHMVNPRSALENCQRYLGAEGVVIASIPNILFFYEITKILLEEDWQYREYGILDDTHLRFFTKKSIIRLFEQSGYRIEEIQGINPFAGKKYKIANLLTFGRLGDWKFTQFAVRARVC
jgi:2-polyprenyl-3-methyl-5-hydroxy-6-metoxy-1,4-benzoquinol methylase